MAFLRIGAILGGILALATVPEALAGPPNVVMIISDDQAWGDYGFMGHPQIRTPNLDRLASQSLAFRRGYGPSSLCSPSLATILTGLYPHQHRVTSNDPPKQPDRAARDAERREMIGYFDQAPTLPKLLSKVNYASFQAGKWWGGHYSHGGFTHGMTHGNPERGGRHGDEGLSIGRAGMAPVFEFVDGAVERSQPFLLWYAPMMPHQPHNPPERLLARYRDKAPTPQIAKYWAMCEWFDETCGQLLDHLDARGIADNTLVVFLSDNGWIQLPNAPRFDPRSKQSPYDGGLRTPILLRWPGKIAPKASDQLASSIDLAPTILAAAGLEPDPAMTGINLMDEKAVTGRKAIFGETFTHDAVDIRRPATSLRTRWVIEGNWKLIWPDPRNEPDAPIELFQLDNDPTETRNLAAQEPARVDRLKRLIDEWWPAEG